jgi:hypothetical protein
MIGRVLDERTPIYNDGYYILTDADEVGYTTERPRELEIVTVEKFTQILVEGSKNIIKTFANSHHNKDVYAVALHVDEYPYVRVYMNTLDCFKTTLHTYQENSSNYYTNEAIRHLKYNLGDFDFEYWDKHMGEHGKYILFFESIFERAPQVDRDQNIEELDGTPIVAFETGVIENGYYLCALKAMQQLIAENTFDCLNKTDDFISYTSVGIDDLEYALVMRKTIELELLYRVFPHIKENDIKFNKVMEQHKNMSVTDALSYWSKDCDSSFTLEILAEHYKPEYEAFLQLERYGNDLTKICLEKLTHLVHLNNLEDKQLAQILFYTEALHFGGRLTEEQIELCNMISSKLREIDNDNSESPTDLDLLVLQYQN